jgi:muconolactone delta-isomerase
MHVMVESRFAVAPTPDILEVVPAEQARGRELDAQGIRQALFIASDPAASWQVFDVASREELDRALASLPLHPYVVETVTQLTDSNRL